jgi:hypothetical protein
MTHSGSPNSGGVVPSVPPSASGEHRRRHTRHQRWLGSDDPALAPAESYATAVARAIHNELNGEMDDASLSLTH